MDPCSKEQLVEELYDVHCRIFDGVDKKCFVKYVIDSRAESTFIQLYRGACGEIVGYLALHFFEAKLGGETVAVLRGETGLLRECRGANIIMRFILDRIAHYMLKHPGRPLYYLGSLVHPSSYAQIARYADRIWPCPEKETSADVAALMSAMGKTFDLAPITKRSPFVCKVGWRTRDSEADQQYWRSSDKPTVRFFLQQNPGYVEGHGLLTLAPVTLGGVLRAARLYAGAKLKKRAQIALSRLRDSLRALLTAIQTT